MKLILSLHETRSDQCRIVPVQIEGVELESLTQERLWKIYQAMWQSLEESFKKTKP